MSKATKVKYVHREVLEDFVLPEPHQVIVKVFAGRGNNLHEVVNDTGDKFLVSMPVKFRRNVWVKRGDFVVIEPIEEGDKVKAEIISILYKQQIKYIKEEGLWPDGFCDGSETRNGSGDNDDEVEEEEIFVNTNRVQTTYEESDEDDSSCDEGDEDTDNHDDSELKEEPV
ncbi:probable RNA-binding protein EIF1AD [Galendromus occidentalis]|uniref:Probable RNA-binding protein EIF1AD n=1 Tax=Galendromus occidentalis TaxID=34638 RepID=A0AAJ7SGW7_9ACAR|nr:probable RNA-binding protein EIF1AD [Galendromus occidentalis]